jgi:hypothetical protein
MSAVPPKKRNIAAAYTVDQSTALARNIIADVNLGVPAGSLHLASTAW